MAREDKKIDKRIKAGFLAASAIHFGLGTAAASIAEALPANRRPPGDIQPDEHSFCAELYRRICGRRSGKQRGSNRLRPWSLMPGN
jgi:hypothetical protein